MTQEEKAKAYDGVREKIAIRFGYNVAEEIFSEYEDSDDEKIRKGIIRLVKGNMPDNDFRKKYIDWLEAQGEHANFRNKIQIGDKVTRNRDGMLVNLSQLKRVAKPADTEKGAKGNEREIPNSAWSEEDEIALGDALWCCKKAVSLAKDENDMGNIWYAENWLESLKERYSWKPSDEQIKVCKEVYADILSAKGFDLGTVNGELNRLEEELKKLREE